MTAPAPDVSSAFYLGAIAALEAFRDQMIADRGRIENELDSSFDVILELLDLTIATTLFEHRE